MDNSPVTLVQAARVPDDTRVLRATECGNFDFYAAEVKYHASCFRDYISKKNLASVVRRHNACKWEERSTACDITERTVFGKAFSSLVHLVESRVISGKSTATMSQLHAKFLELLEQSDELNLSCRRENLKKRLIKCFQKRLEFWKPKRANEAEIAFSSSIAKGDLLEAFLNLKQEIDEVGEIEDMSAVDDDDFTSPSSVMTHLLSALELRSDVIDVTETRI